jgi:hypothetical protein
VPLCPKNEKFQLNLIRYQIYFILEFINPQSLSKASKKKQIDCDEIIHTIYLAAHPNSFAIVASAQKRLPRVKVRLGGSELGKAISQ